ncbi:MAG: hypothetical protein HON83_02195, partial [Candidatus Marinimicrobia bacterium]|nr:hypothetical protein [Candidatus Neomarinimicrobiota bacterium]
MPANTGVAGVTNEVLQEALSAYSDEAYTNARKLSGTGIVGSNSDIDTNTETFIGQVRWDKPLNPNINVASITDSTDGTTTDTSTDMLRYVKTVRTHGARNVNMKKVITQRDGLAKIGRDFGETQAQDEHNAILSVLKGVAISEALTGAGEGSGSAGVGGQSFDNDPSSSTSGFYVDLGSDKIIKTFDNTKASMEQGAQRAEGFLNALGMGWKDYELPFYYLVTSPETMASLRSANLVDQDTVSDGSIDFQTIFGGKFRLIQTRAAQGFTSAQLTKINTGAGVDIVGTKTSFIVAPGALAMAGLEVPTPLEIDRDAKAYMGGGTTEIWKRWGYVLAPAGYNWNGSEDKFVGDAEYMYAVEGGTAKALTSV